MKMGFITLVNIHYHRQFQFRNVFKHVRNALMKSNSNVACIRMNYVTNSNKHTKGYFTTTAKKNRTNENTTCKHFSLSAIIFSRKNSFSAKNSADSHNVEEINILNAVPQSKLSV